MGGRFASFGSVIFFRECKATLNGLENIAMGLNVSRKRVLANGLAAKSRTVYSFRFVLLESCVFEQWDMLTRQTSFAGSL